MTNTLNLQIEDIAARLDYRLQYRFNYCRTCEAKGDNPHRFTGTYIHRTQAEVDAGITHNVNQYHGQLGTKECHIEKPTKFCNFCGKVYSYDDTDCPPCWNRVKEITSNELAVQYYEKQIAKLNRNKGQLTIQEKEYQISEWLKAIELHISEADRLKRKHD